MTRPAFTTSGKTRTAAAFALHAAAAGFCATSCCSALRDLLTSSSAPAASLPGNATAASVSPNHSFHFDAMFIIFNIRLRSHVSIDLYALILSIVRQLYSKSCLYEASTSIGLYAEFGHRVDF